MKKNPQDATRVNVRAMNKKFERVFAEIKKLKAAIKELKKRK